MGPNVDANERVTPLSNGDIGRSRARFKCPPATRFRANSFRVARVYLCVSIDCECDKGPNWRSERPLAFSGIADGIGRRLQPLFRRFGAKPTYLLSPEVILDGESASVLATLLGDAELGAHLHGEYAEPGAFLPEITDAFQRDYPPEIEREKLDYLTQSFIRAFGYRPTAFRAGRFGIGPHTLGFLEALKYAVESSVTPFMDWSDKAPGLSFRGAPTQPYRPDPQNAGAPGTSSLLEVPVTIRPRAAQKLPFIGKHLDPRWLRPTRGTARGLIDVARDEIAAARAARPYANVVLNAMFHNVEIMPGKSPYAKTAADAQAITDRLAALLDFARRESISVVGLSDIPEIIAEDLTRDARGVS